MISLGKKGRYGQVFLIALVIAIAMFLPFVIYNKGYFLFAGDFNVQQIPFYKLAQEAVRTGNIFWNWGTDLGANFIGTYSFYLLGSPFFWLTIPFPTEILPYLMAPLFVLKFSLSAVTAYAYIKRFVSNQDYAVIGALLYAFSGFSVYNIFFNHFNDVVVVFPLLLIALEEYMENDRRGFFALAVALCAVVNYFFFVGQVVFLLMYFCVKTFSNSFKVTVKKFLFLAFESVLGVGIAMFLLLPSVLAITGNPRVNSQLTGYGILFYGDIQKYAAIIHSFFFPPDLPFSLNFFPDGAVKWTSLSGFLPLFSMCGVIAYMTTRRRSWPTRLFWLSALMALVPFLNSAFYLFNSSYYARWFYMPVLIICLMTALSLDRFKEVAYSKAITVTAIITFAFSLIGVLPKLENNQLVFFALVAHPERLWASVCIAFLGITLMSIVVEKMRSGKPVFRFIVLGIGAITFIYSSVYISTGKMSPTDDQWFIDNAIGGYNKISLPDEGFSRVDTFGGTDNQGMFWNLPNLQAFNSVVPASIMEFYPSVGVKRDVSSKPGSTRYELRALLSVKWLLIKEGDGTEVTQGFQYYTTQSGFKIYKNSNFIPMGFAYDYYMDESTFKSTLEQNRAKMMMRAIYLSDEQIGTYGSLLTPIPLEQMTDLDNLVTFSQTCDARRAQSTSSFIIDNRGFTATIDLAKENLVFFSVPYDEGWTATVNGQSVAVEKVNSGLSAVLCPKGASTIRFEYTAPGLKSGMMMTAISLAVLAAYVVVNQRNRKKRLSTAAAEGSVDSDE